MFSLFTPTGYSGPDGMQQARCPNCGVSLGALANTHAPDCPYPRNQWLQAQPMSHEQQMALWGRGLANALAPEPEVVRYRGSRYSR